MKRFVALLLSALMLVSIPTLSVNAASEKITKCLDLANVGHDDIGNGYEWDNIEKTLTMDDLNLSTTDEYGIKLPEGATIILNGDNYITASKYGIHCLNSLIFKGSGTLTINAVEVGIFAASTLSSDVIQFFDGNITIINTKIGVYSEDAKLSFLGSTVSITASDNSVYGKDVRISGGNLDFHGPLYSKSAVNIAGATVAITASKPAITSATNEISITAKNIMVGNTTSTLSNIGEYAGQNCVKIIPQTKKASPSLLFGEGVSPVWDYVVIISAVLAIGAVVAVPIILKQKKTAKLIALSQANAEKSKKKK